MKYQYYFQYAKNYFFQISKTQNQLRYDTIHKDSNY